MNLNSKIIILISLVGIFTVSSFIFDQMVIYSEDKIEKTFSIKDHLITINQAKI